MLIRLPYFLLFDTNVVESNARLHALTAVLVKIYARHSCNTESLFWNVGTCLSIYRGSYPIRRKSWHIDAVNWKEDPNWILVQVSHPGTEYFKQYVIIIINIKNLTLWSVPSPKLQLLAPTHLRSSNCSPSLWSVVVWFQRNSVLCILCKCESQFRLYSFILSSMPVIRSSRRM